MPEDLNLRALKHRAHSLSRALFLHLDGYVEDYPSGVPLALASTLKRATAAIDSKIESAGERRLRGICRVLIELTGDVMILLDHTHTAMTPRGLSQLLEQLHGKLYPKTTLLVSPSNYYVYEISDIYPGLRSMFSNFMGEGTCERIFGRYGAGITVVSFPRMERENILLHAVFGHEFGHPIADEFTDIVDPKEPNYNSNLDAMHERLATIHAKEWKKLGKEARERKTREVNERTLNIKKRGLQELLSDVASIQIFGPSALFAAAEILLEKTLDSLPSGEDELYPPSRWRLRVMCNELERSGQFAALNSLTVEGENAAARDAAVEYIRYIQRLTEVTTDREVITAELDIAIAYEWIESTFERGVAHVSSRLSEVKYEAATITEELPYALDRVQAGVPPSEYGDPPHTTALNWRTAILAGWCCKLYLCKGKKAALSPEGATEERELPQWKDRHDKIVSVHELALKGIEDSILKSEYDQSPFGKAREAIHERAGKRGHH